MKMLFALGTLVGSNVDVELAPADRDPNEMLPVYNVRVCDVPA